MTWETIRGCERAELAGGVYALWVVPEWKTPLVDKVRWTFEDERCIVASNTADDFDTATRDVVSTATRVLTFLAGLGAEEHRQRELERALKDLEALQ
jgi:hypothetical protein